MINVADTYNSLALGNFHATWSRNLRPHLWSDGLDAAEEPPAWKQFRLKRCTLNHLSGASNTGEMDSASAAIAFQSTNSLVSAEMWLTFCLKLIITQKDFSFLFLSCHKAVCSLYESAKIFVSLDCASISKYSMQIHDTNSFNLICWMKRKQRQETTAHEGRNNT